MTEKITTKSPDKSPETRQVNIPKLNIAQDQKEMKPLTMASKSKSIRVQVTDVESDIPKMQPALSKYKSEFGQMKPVNKQLFGNKEIEKIEETNMDYTRAPDSIRV